ncbi:MAG TPA: DUF5681 domain-containing protein [Kofleriaceae bacterium]
MAWEKGKSGNPAGSPKRRLITSHIERELLQAAAEGNVTKARKIAEQVVSMAEGGDKWAIQFVTERTEGRPDQHVSISRSVRELTDADLTAIATGSGEGAVGEAGGAEVPSRVH